MGAITLPNFRITADVHMNTRLKDGGVAIDWAGLTGIKAWVYSDPQKALAGRVDVTIDSEDSTVLACTYPASRPQYLGVNRLIIQASYMGSVKTFDKPVFNFVARTADQAGEQIVIDDPEVDVEIEVTDTSSSVLDNAIAAAIKAADDAEEAAAKAEEAAGLMPYEILNRCIDATGAAQDATAEAYTAAGHAAPIIGQNGNWWIWNQTQHAYVDSGEKAQGPKGDTGISIQSVEQTQESQESEGENVVTVTMTDGTQAQFTVRNGKQGIQGVPGVANAKYKQVDALPTASAATMDYIYLVESATSGVYNMSYTEEDGGLYTWKSLGTTAIQLSDYATNNDLSQLAQEALVEKLNIDGVLSGVFGVNGYRKKSDGSYVDSQSGTFKCFTFPAKAGTTVSFHAKTDSDVSAIAFSPDGTSWASVVSGIGATSLRDYSYTLLTDGFIAVSCRADAGTKLSIDDSLSAEIKNVREMVPFYPASGKLSGGTGQRIKYSDGSVIRDNTYQFFIIPVVAGARVYFSAYSAVADASAIISFSEDGETWTPLVQYSNDDRFAEFFAGLPKDGYVGLCHKKNESYSPSLRVENIAPSGYQILYDYAIPKVEGARGSYTVGTRYYLTYNAPTRILVSRIFVSPGNSFNLSVSGISGLATMNPAYLMNGSFVSKPSSLPLSDGVISGTMPSTANELVFVLKKSDNSSFTDNEISALSVKIIHADNEIPRAQAMTAFMDAMRRKATHIGMTESTFNNPHGGYYEGYNTSTVADILKMALFACAYPRVWDFWSTNSETVQIYGANARTATIASTTQASLDTYYEEMHPGQTNPYHLLGKKGGGWSSSPKAYSFIGVTEIGGKYVVAVSATTQGDGTTGRVARLKGLIELFDIAAIFIAGQSIEGMAITQVENGIVAVLPEFPNARKDQQPQVIYSLNPNAEYNPASTSKVLALLTMLDIISDYEECHSILQEETSYNDSTYTAMAGDIETMNTSIFTMMVASNSANCMALARVCGEKIMKSRNEFI